MKMNLAREIPFPVLEQVRAGLNYNKVFKGMVPTEQEVYCWAIDRGGVYRPAWEWVKEAMRANPAPLWGCVRATVIAEVYAHLKKAVSFTSLKNGRSCDLLRVAEQIVEEIEADWAILLRAREGVTQ